MNSNSTNATKSGPGFLDTIKNAIGLGGNTATNNATKKTNAPVTNAPAPVTVGGRRRKSRKSRKSRKVKKSRKGSRRH